MKREQEGKQARSLEFPFELSCNALCLVYTLILILSTASLRHLNPPSPHLPSLEMSRSEHSDCAEGSHRALATAKVSSDSRLGEVS